MQTIFNILDFGAIGDGITDCTPLVQSALDAAATCSGKVIVPPGKYMVGKLNMHGEGVSLVGTSSWSFRNDGSSVFCLNDENADCLLDITSAFGCLIQEMSLNGGKIGNNIHGIKLYWKEYNGGGQEDTPTIDDCRVSSFSGDGVHFEHVWCFSVRHSMFTSNCRAGFFVDGWDAFVLDNWFSCNEGGGFVSGEIIASVTCTGNRVEWNKKGGFILQNGDSFNLNSNFFDRNFGPAIKTESIKLATVSGNVFRRNGASDKELTDRESCHLHMKNCQSSVVTGNTMGRGIGDHNDGPLSPLHDIIIEDCIQCIIKDNVMPEGAVGEAVISSGDNSTCVFENNICG